MSQKISVVSGYFGAPSENFGLTNFIQVYVFDKPYFRYGDCEHNVLLEKILLEFDFSLDKSVGKDHSHNLFPKPKDENYSLVGTGQIREAYIINSEDKYQELDSMDYYVIFPSSSRYDLLPSISHLQKILNYFDKPIIFASDPHLTEEQKVFLNSYSELDEILNAEELNVDHEVGIDNNELPF